MAARRTHNPEAGFKSYVRNHTLGYRQVGKTQDFDSCMRWFESIYPNHYKSAKTCIKSVKFALWCKNLHFKNMKNVKLIPLFPMKNVKVMQLFPMKNVKEEGEKMQKFISKPSIDMYAGITVTKDTTLEYKNENVTQTLKDLVFDSFTVVKGENYTSTYHTVITLNEGDVLIFEEEGRGYIKPVENFVTVEEAIKELEYLKEG